MPLVSAATSSRVLPEVAAAAAAEEADAATAEPTAVKAAAAEAAAAEDIDEESAEAEGALDPASVAVRTFCRLGSEPPSGSPSSSSAIASS